MCQVVPQVTSAPSLCHSSHGEDVTNFQTRVPNPKIVCDFWSDFVSKFRNMFINQVKRRPW